MQQAETFNPIADARFAGYLGLDYVPPSAEAAMVWYAAMTRREEFNTWLVKSGGALAASYLKARPELTQEAAFNEWLLTCAGAQFELDTARQSLTN